ncbi:MAG: hypothetical protein HYY30_11530 [Chloroflexi bacterium]|nr:hypothetical protein [Chloroflexota bacterium]
MRFLLALSFLVSALVLTSKAPVWANAGDCEFVLGFKTLHDQIPNVVGECLDNAHFDADLGETLQATTGSRTDGALGGLLVWRKVDNLTWFSDGVNTWINGPQGLQQRLNTERFPWELETLENAAYTLQDMPFVLNVGKAELITDSPQVIRLFANLHQNNVAYGDLNGDGIADAAVRIVLNTGGSGDFNHLAAMVSNGGVIQQAASAFLGDRVRVNAVSIADGVITVDEIVHGASDLLCCPTVPKTVKLRLLDGELEEVAQ